MYDNYAERGNVTKISLRYNNKEKNTCNTRGRHTHTRWIQCDLYRHLDNTSFTAFTKSMNILYAGISGRGTCYTFTFDAWLNYTILFSNCD